VIPATGIAKEADPETVVTSVAHDVDGESILVLGDGV
jgi:hypothetical protein